MAKYMDGIKGAISKQIDDYERGKSELSEEELEEVMPKVIKFYNKRDPNLDVFRAKYGCILFIQTPKAIFEKDEFGKIKKKDGKPILKNGFDKYDKYPPTSYLLKNCKFFYNGQPESLGLFATSDVWKTMKQVYDKKAFIKCNSLSIRYKRIGSDAKAVKIDAFLDRLNAGLEPEDPERFTSIEELDESDYMTFYGATITQVIE